MSLRHRLLALALALGAGALLLALLVWRTVEAVRIGSPPARQQLESQELIADIAPPSATLLPAYEETLRLADEPNPDVRRQVLATIATYQKTYQERMVWWGSRLEDGELRTLVTETARIPAEEFFRVTLERYGPAILASDRIAARRLMNGELRTAYLAHEQAVARAIVLAREREVAITRQVEEQVTQRIGLLVIGSGVGVVLLAVALALTIRHLQRSVAGLSAGLARMAGGDLGAHCPEGGRDEFALIGAGINRMAIGLAGTVDEVRRRSASLGQAGTGLVAIGSEVSDLSSVSHQRAVTATGQADQLVEAAASVAQAAAGLEAAAHDIARNLQESTHTVGEAVTLARSTDALVAGLADAGRQIGEVVAEIAAVAASTRLLALNAAIEAASAGEAGRGFAVVANEVKTLAQQTANATDTIAQRVAAIQASTAEAARAIKTIGEVITRIEAHHTSIAAAVDEQTATTGIISGDLSRIRDQGSSIRADLAAARLAAEQVAEQVARVKVTAQDLHGSAAALEGAVAGLATGPATGNPTPG